MAAPPATAAEEIIRGVVRRVRFRNPENGYTVLVLEESDNATRAHTVVAHTSDLRAGQHVLARGTFSTHPKFGQQFTASSLSEIEPSTPDALETYLASGIFPGIGPKTAHTIVAALGTEALEIARSDPKRLAKAARIGPKKAAELAEKLRTRDAEGEVLRFLIEHQVSPNLARKVYAKYENRALQIVRENPYLLAYEMRGVGFTTADSIALKLGLDRNSPNRIKAGLHYALEKASDDGHCFLPLDVLFTRARALLELDDNAEGLDEEPLRALEREGAIIREDDRIWLTHLNLAEQAVAEFVSYRLSPRGIPSYPRKEFDRALPLMEKELAITFSPEQREALRISLEHRLLVITGGPGCGKTTVVRGLCALFKLAEKRIMLAAPTGRAAQRMAQVSDLPASTIHRLLKYDPMRRRFQHGGENPLEADLIIIDETSMLDISLARDLFNAISADTTVVLVGDKDQLPSVGPGRVFGDILALPAVPIVPLTRLFRRSEESSITTIAHQVNAGIMPEIPAPDGVTKVDAYFIDRPDADAAAMTIEQLVSDQLPKKFGFAPHEIMVLTPSNRGPLGTLQLNLRLQERLRGSEGAKVEVGSFRLTRGDRVCQRVNNYQLDPAGVYNGDSGEVFQLDPENRQVVVELWDGRLVTYESEDLHQLSLAYAITVHRSQGSEMPCVVLALHESHYTLLERQLIYTGITRAKRLLVIVGSRRALRTACQRANARKRNTWLQERTLSKLL